MATANEKFNFYRTCHIVLDDVSNVLRGTFYDAYKSWSGQDWQPSCGEKLRKKVGGTFRDQKELLKEGNPEEWDTTLLCLVLLHKMWPQNVLTPCKVSAISDIRDIRNKCFAHRHEASTSKADLDDMIKAIAKAYEKILDGKPNKAKAIQRLKAIATEEIGDTGCIQRFKECQLKQESLRENFEELAIHVDDVARTIKDKVNEQAERIKLQEETSYVLNERMKHQEETSYVLNERIKHQEETSYDLNERMKHQEETSYDLNEQVSCFVNEKPPHLPNTLNDKMENLDARVSGLEDKMSSLALKQTDPMHTGEPQTTAMLSKKPKKNYRRRKSVSTADSDTDSGLSTAAENLEISSTSNADDTIITPKHEVPITLDESSQLVIPFFAHAQTTVEEYEENQPQYGASTLNMHTIPQEEGSHDKGKLKNSIALKSCDDFDKKMLISGQGAGQKPYIGEQQLKLQLEEAEQNIDKLVKEKHKLEQEIEATNARQRQFSDLVIELNMIKERLSCLEKERASLKDEVLNLRKENLMLKQNAAPSINETSFNLMSLSKCPRLGCGSFGTVYIYTDPDTGKKYAAKAFNQVYDNAAVGPEIRMFPHLKHENIVQYIGVHCCFPGQYPIVLMELMTRNLHEYIITSEATAVSKEKLRIICNIFDGLHYLHTHKPMIIHRDMTAKNVLLDKSAVAKIADFGNSRFLNPDQLSSMTRHSGTIGYMAPEVLAGHYNEKVDIFSCGHLMLFLFINRYPSDLKPHVSETEEGDEISYNEVQRRSEYFKILHEICAKLNLPTVIKSVQDCLSINPKRRPSASMLTSLFLPLLQQE